ncbi:hypothetical protein ACWD3I_29800 [Streptomyces sp. NPDC002817]|uniref:hypothetical protein n=1 Tax=Streptomyces sp. NPDC088357 TaxID=3154655 RepID=UPI003427263B
MTSYAAPERLLALGTAYTRHHDALSGLLHSGTRSPHAFARHVPRTQALAREALDVPPLLHGMSLYFSPDVRSGLDRIKQLATPAATAADHLLDAVDFLHDAPPPTTSLESMTVSHRRALWEAGRHIGLALQLTALGADDCLDTAALFARQLHRQKIAPEHQLLPLSPTQHTTLSAVARGCVSVHHEDGKVWTDRGEARVPISTVRALETRGLVLRETCPRPARQDRIHLTPDGRRTLAASLGRPHTTPRTTRPAARAAPNTRHTASR